ncbi:hypothetical protein Tco_0493737 [Tanacetum coccineum]
MERMVFVSVVENDLDETFKQNEFLKDQLLEASLAEDIKNLVITSYVEIRNKDLHDETERTSKESKDASNESKTADTVCNDAFEVSQELSKRIVELEKDLSKFEAKSIAFEIALQHKSRETTSLKTLQKENENFMASLQIENALLKQTYKDLFDSVQRTTKFEAYFEKLEKMKVVLERQLARKVDDSKAENDRFLKEINHLRTQLENLKGKRVETKLDKSLILGKLPLLNNKIEQILKQIASLESKLASEDIHSCQKEYHELRTSYNALKVKFDYLNQKKWNINVSKSSKPNENVSEKVHTGESSKPFLRRVSQFTTYSLQQDRKFSKKSQSFETFFPQKGFKTRASNAKNQSFETPHSCFTPIKVLHEEDCKLSRKYEYVGQKLYKTNQDGFTVTNDDMVRSQRQRQKGKWKKVKIKISRDNDWNKTTITHKNKTKKALKFQISKSQREKFMIIFLGVRLFTNKKMMSIIKAIIERSHMIVPWGPVATQAAFHFIDKISLAKDFMFNTYEVEWSPCKTPGKVQVYALWKVPHLLPAFILKGGEVSRYVRSTCMSSSKALKAGIRGKALKICHHYRDALPLAPATPAAARNAISQRPNIPACKKYEIRHYYGSSSAGYSHRNGTYS